MPSLTKCLQLGMLISLCLELVSGSKCASSLISLNDGSCAVVLGTTGGFCDALRICGEHSQKTGKYFFLTGLGHRVLTSLHFPGQSQYIWTSIDDILVHRGSAQDGWRDADPRNLLYVSENNDIDWEDQHPNGKDPVVAVRADTQKASAVPMNGIEGQVVCRSIEDEVLKPTPTTQLRPDFPLTLPVLTNSDPSSDGCHQSSTEPTLIACAIRCQRNIQCRSMYYNAEDHTCVHMLYVDARLPSVFRLKSEEWKRYAKTAIISKSAAR
ncbi:hypothetical protein CSKR_202924 [Clonorchis sinensis]|uniref:Apple domain-containing protein n=1 Tax=Clonorchis sinensis TaxID=79923 RepID=A0A3R7GJ95_CLOSI|nr:hypothetical protein CSKR_202924 [Clonorchis sinensis]KAG5444066.1 hypothetical protein CSKR_202924 [Clonorchis sinensis]